MIRLVGLNFNKFSMQNIMGIRLYYILSIAIICISIIAFMLSFERKKPTAKEVVVLSSMTAFAILGRVMFFMTPQIKPSAAIIIIIGIGLGRHAGFLSGVLMAFISDLFFGQGPWTPWQMLAFGILGYLAGVLFYRWNKKVKKIPTIIYGFLSTFIIYGLIMDTQTLLSTMAEFKKEAFLSVYLSGIFFNLVHGISTVIFMWFLEIPILKKLNRIKTKYGIYKTNNVNN